MEPLMLIMLAAAAALLVSGCLKNLFLQKMMAKFRICNTSRFFWKILRLPMSFFDQRFSGDIVSREQNNEEIAAILFQRIVPSIMDLVLVCCLMFLMFLLDPRMAGVVLAAGVMPHDGINIVSAFDTDIILLEISLHHFAHCCFLW